MKKVHWAIVIMLAILLAVWLGSKVRLPGRLPGKTPAESERPRVKTEQIIKQNVQTTLSAFPGGFPAEEGIANSSGYKYIPANSLNEQSTLEYVSAKSLTENKQIFTEFLTKNGFEIVNRIDQPNLVFLYAKKEQNDLSVKIEARNQQIMVSANYLKR